MKLIHKSRKPVVVTFSRPGLAVLMSLAESFPDRSLLASSNVLIEGFGIHTPGSGRKKQVKSKWDTLHPGRSLARDLPSNSLSQDKIVRLLSDFFAGKPVKTLSPTEAVIEEEGKEEE